MTLVQPPAEMQITIRKQLNEDVKTRDSDLQHIKDWLKKQPHLPDSWGEFYFYFFFRRYNFQTKFNSSFVTTLNFIFDRRSIIHIILSTAVIRFDCFNTR